MCRFSPFPLKRSLFQSTCASGHKSDSPSPRLASRLKRAFLAFSQHWVIQGEAGAVIRGKKGSGGITVKKTNQALIIGIYDEPMTPGQCNMIVERLGDYLIDQGL